MRIPWPRETLTLQLSPVHQQSGELSDGFATVGYLVNAEPESAKQAEGHDQPLSSTDYLRGHLVSSFGLHMVLDSLGGR